jgi:hypothetical protein
MSGDAFVGEKLIWLLGSLVLGGSSLIIGKVIGGQGKIDAELCDERRMVCVAHTNTKIEALHEQIVMMDKKLDRLLERD